MTEEQEQTTPEQESEHVEQEQRETGQPAVNEAPLLLEKPEEPRLLDKPQDRPLLEKPAERLLLDKPAEPELLASQTQPAAENDETPPQQDETEAVADQIEAVLETAEAERATPKKKRTRKDIEKYEQVVSYFAACGRCSYFLAGYRVVHGVENLETAVSNAKAGWLSLSWGHNTRSLLIKTYGIELYADTYHYDGCCSECGRHYTVQVSDSENYSGKLRIQIGNRRRKS